MSIFTDLLRLDGESSDEAVLQDILTALRVALNFPAVYFVRYDGAKAQIVDVSGHSGAFGLDPGPCQKDAEVYFQMLRDSEVPSVIENTMTEPMAQHVPWLRRSRIGAISSCLIQTASGSVLGAICAFTAAPKRIHSRDKKTMAMLAKIASNLITNEASAMTQLSALRRRIRNVISDSRVNIHLQPIVDLLTTETRGYEALSRFEHEDDTLTPRIWFDDARRVGMQPLLECAAMAEAIELLRFLPNDTYLSVNASPETVRIGAVADILQDGPPDRMVLDLTEHADAEQLDGLHDALKELKSMNVQIALDNFGAGDLQLPSVEKLEPDILKLDISLVKSINRSSVSQAMTRSIVSFANDIDAALIAVGIEHESERAKLAELGVRFGQGFLLARPDAPGTFGFDLVK